MKNLNLVIGIFEWLNLIISVYLVIKLVFTEPVICINTTEVMFTIIALIILIFARIIKVVVELITED